MEYRKNRKTPDVMLLTNNQRKMHGVPMWRKKNKKKRYYTRCEADETITVFWEYCNRE